MRSTLPSVITDRNYTIQMVSEGLYSLGGRGISEPDTVLWDLKCRNTGRWDGAVWDRTANYTLARHITHGIYMWESSASEFRFTELQTSVPPAEITGE